jgi:hypothetical protein
MVRGSLAGRAAPACALAGIAGVAWLITAAATAQGPPAPEASRPAPPSLPEMPKPLNSAVRPRAVASFEGTPAPGLPITLRADRSTGDELRVRWVQTRGPQVRLDDPEALVAHFTTPEGSGSLGFELVAANAAGVDSANLTILVDDHGQEAPATSLRADAGDDQLGLVGRQVTLNGMRSEPRGRIGFRWIQTGGPEARLKIEQGQVFSFVPTAPGVYSFALVVASGSAISEPDIVRVSVGAGTGSGMEPPSVVAPETLRDVARSALGSIRGGPDAAEDLAQAFHGVADRMALYRAYADVFLEMSRRLEWVLPEEPAKRAVWNDRLFAPLTTQLIEGLRPEGLDLRQADAQTTPLTAAQKARLADMLREMAEGFRATQPAPSKPR